MNLLKRLDIGEVLKDLYIKYDGTLLINNFGDIIDMSSEIFDSKKVKIEGNLNIVYLSKNEIKIKGEIKNICIK